MSIPSLEIAISTKLTEEGREEMGNVVEDHIY
jgi:hypothetical protein